MHQGRTIIAQLMDFAPYYRFQQCVNRYDGNKWVQTFSCWEQFLSMSFAQLTLRNSLRDIEVSLGAQRHKLYHLGFRSPVKRNTLSNANKNRDYRIYQDFAHHLIDIARPLYADEDLGLDLKNTVYALDSTIIDLCLSLFPWAIFRSTKAAIKMHTLMDLQGSIPVFIDVTAGRVSDVNLLDYIPFEAGAIIIMDRGYLDFKRLYTFTQHAVFFVIRAKKNLQFRRRYSEPVDKSTGVQCDQIIVLTGTKSAKNYPQCLRLIRYKDVETGDRFVFLSNNFIIPAKTIADLYRYRWQIELFFKWIKQHLRIKSFYGTSDNAVKTQIWIAISVYVLVAIVKKQLGLEESIYTILQILSVSLFEKVPILQLFTKSDYNVSLNNNPNQLSLFD